MEKLQLELNQKQNEIFNLQAKLSSSEEQTTESRKRLELMKEVQSNKEKEVLQLQADVRLLALLLS